jgi:hypothetical protein
VVALAVAVATALVRPTARSVVARGLGGLFAGLVAGALGGGANGVLRYHYHEKQLGIVVGFLVAGAIIGLARVAGRSALAGFFAGAVAGAFSGWLVSSVDVSAFKSQALPAVIIVASIAGLELARQSVAHAAGIRFRPDAAGAAAGRRV